MKNAPVEMFLGPSIVGGFESPQKVCSSTTAVNGVAPVRYLRADLVTPLIEALTTINNALREHERERRLDELQLASYRALARVREELL